MPADVDRRRGLLIMLAVYGPLTVMASAVSPGHRLFTAGAMIVAFALVLVVILVVWRIWPEEPFAGPLRALDREHRLVVARAVRAGDPVHDPALAEVATSYARGMTRLGSLFIVSAVLGVTYWIWSAAHHHGALMVTAEVAGGAFWIVHLVRGARLVSRARRAEAANGVH